MIEFLQLLLGRIRERRLIEVWLGFMVITWLLFYFVLRAPMDGTTLTGAAFFYAVSTLLTSAAWNWTRRLGGRGGTPAPGTETAATQSAPQPPEEEEPLE